MIKKIIFWFNSSLRRRAALMIFLGMAVLLGVFFVYDITAQRQALEGALLAKGKQFAISGAASVEQAFNEALQNGVLTREEIFDRNYEPIPGTDPTKYHTSYDAFTDENLIIFGDSLLNDADVVFAAAVDINGYLPTHNSKYSQPLTGNYEQDVLNSRTKRIFNDEVGITAAKNTQDYLQQVYYRDTGELMWDISAPIYIDGEHWGGFRIGFSLENVNAQLATITRRIIFAAILLLFGVVFVAYIMTRPMRLVAEMSEVADSLVRGDISAKIDIVRSDEVGVLADSFRNIINYNKEMAFAVERMAKGDLTATVAPKSEVDVIGLAFQKMLKNLNEMMNEVIVNAHSLEQAAEILSNASTQAGYSTDQITQTMHQVADGVTQQAATITRSAGTMEQLNRAIDGVAQGAQEQARAAGKASEVTTEISEAIQRVAFNAKGVTDSAQEAIDAARIGKQTIQDTIKVMTSIQDKVGDSAKKVQEMEIRSNEIGVIVEKIEEIASQTNLLALNAAIEAARAGEHGKGFSVVADEVRKLAERSAQSSGEIIALIRGIQNTAKDAKEAMNKGTDEIKHGVGQTNSAGMALEQILDAIEKAYQKASNTGEVANQINQSTARLVEAVDTVSAVIEENTAATEEMAAGSNEVNQSIMTVASISEQNSAAVEEVSASTVDMNEKVGDVNESAQALSRMSQKLKEIVNRFQITG